MPGNAQGALCALPTLIWAVGHKQGISPYIVDGDKRPIEVKTLGQDRASSSEQDSLCRPSLIPRQHKSQY